MILLIVSAVMGGIVVILGAVYAYVYYTQIRIRPRHKYPVRTHPPTIQMNQDPDPEVRHLFHPFMILAYAGRFKRSDSDFGV